MSSVPFDRRAAQDAFLDSLAKSFNNPNSSPDLRIKCDGQEWLCHKHVLTRQSEWFQKACNGGFKESKADTIELHDDDKDAVSALLEFCYAFTYTGDHLPAFHVRVFALAEKYFVPGLTQLAADNFSTTGAHDATTLRNITDAISVARTAVYDQGNVLRTAIMKLVMLRGDSLLTGKCPAFDALLDDHPSLAADIARAMAKKWITDEWERESVLYWCPCGCGAAFRKRILGGESYTYFCVQADEEHELTGLEWDVYRCGEY